MAMSTNSVTCFCRRKNQRGVVTAEAERVAHHMRQLRRTHFRDGRQADGRINFTEARVRRELLPSQYFDADDGFNRAARRESVAEKSFRAGKRRDVRAEQ